MGSVVAVPRLWSTGAITVAPGLNCSAVMWDLPRPGIEPVSSALVGKFFTTKPPGKPNHKIFIPHSVNVIYRIYLFGCIEPSLHPRIEFHLNMVYNPFNVLLNVVC